jgi:hypothetical protein
MNALLWTEPKSETVGAFDSLGFGGLPNRGWQWQNEAAREAEAGSAGAHPAEEYLAGNSFR